MSDCIFCKIAQGDIPAEVVYENEHVIAFEDVNPQMPVHTLIIPKQHFSHIGDEIPVDTMGHLFSAVPEVAACKGIAESGYRIQVNTGDDAQQTVHHIHIHVLGGARMNIDSPRLNK